ncbi:DUF134 domain-containing protein [bacterium]|nr:DUF134 domain-containing protein [bacterium]
MNGQNDYIRYKGRPRLKRRIKLDLQADYFKPQGVPMRFLEIIELSKEEVEALRLKNIKNLNQSACAKKMNTSQSTFQRILYSAYKKISQALVEGKGIRILKD